MKTKIVTKLCSSRSLQLVINSVAPVSTYCTQYYKAKSRRKSWYSSCHSDLPTQVIAAILNTHINAEKPSLSCMSMLVFKGETSLGIEETKYRDGM